MNIVKKAIFWMDKVGDETYLSEEMLVAIVGFDNRPGHRLAALHELKRRRTQESHNDTTATR
jgi:hypothetical protein